MAFDWDLLVPYKYSNQYISLRDLHAIMSRDYHPEYVRRFIAWLHYKNGNVGAGGLARTEQPDKPGFAPSLEQSFHWAGQRYADGVTGACAVDTVYKDGPDPGDAHDGIAWTEVPIQGGAEAVKWGIHANVGVPGAGESWHIQPIEIDGHGSWLKAGRPAPVAGYPIPAEHDPSAPVNPPPITPPPSSERMVDMFFVIVTNGPESGVKETWLLCDGTQLSHVVDGHAAALMQRVPGIAAVRPATAAETAGLIRSCRTMTAPPPEWAGTAWGALWEASQG